MRRARLLGMGVVCIEIWACSSGNTGPFVGAVGAVSGSVTSNLLGGIGAATVVITPSHGSALPAVQTFPGGAFLVPSVPDGSGSVAVSSLPPNCAAPSPAGYSGLVGSDTEMVNIAVTCTPPGAPFGTVTGHVTGSTAGIRFIVFLTPAGDSAFTGVRTDTSGAYTISGVPVGGNGGAGSVSAAGGAGGAVCAGAADYTGLTGGGTLTVDIRVGCIIPH